MKRGKKLIALVAILALLAVAYVAVLNMGGDGEEKTTEATSESILSVFTLSVADIEKLTWTYEGETVTLVQGDKWYYADDPNFPLDREFMDPVVAAVTKQYYTRTITEGIDMDAFGLTDPQLTVRVETKDGKTIALDYGILNIVTGHYYMKMEGDDKVYTVTEDGVEPFFVGIYDLVKVEEKPAMTTVTAFTRQVGDVVDRVRYSETGFAQIYSDQYLWVYEDVNGKYWELDEYNTQEYLMELTEVNWAGCVAYNATDAELEAYGLLDPDCAFTMHYTKTEAVEGSENRELQEKSYTITCGKTTGPEDKHTYVRLNDSRYVYLLLTDTIDILRNTDIIEKMGVDYICNILFDDVVKVTAKNGDATMVVNYSHETVTDEAGNETVKNIYAGEGFTVKDSYMQLFEACVSALAREAICDPAEVEPTFTVTIERDRVGFGTLTLEFAPYDNNFYRCTFNGDSMNLVNKRDVGYMMEVMDLVMKGE